MRFEELAGYLPRIEARLDRDYRDEARRRPKVFRPYVGALREFTLRGGKRFRALLVLAGHHLATGRAPTAALPAAAAFEHFQTWMLVHDDIIDRSETRRGKPTLHRLFEEPVRGRRTAAEAEAYGRAMAITLGDLAEPFTVGAFLATAGPPARRLSVLTEYVRMTRETAYGQALDIRNAEEPIENVSEADVLAVHRYKTAAYTVSSPLRIGAILGGAPAGLLSDLEAIGLDLGVAFQLRDDVLGTGFDADGSGKSANDLQEGKRTLLVVRAWDRADAAGRDRLRRVLHDPGASSDDLEAARAVIRATGSLTYSESRIAALHRRATRRIDRSRHLRPGGRALLHEIGEKLVHRAV